MAFIATPAKSISRKIGSIVLIFLGFLGIIAIIAPRVTTKGPVVGLSESDIAHADTPPRYSQGTYSPGQSYYQGTYAAYAEGSYGNGYAGGDGDDCGDDAGDDDGDDDGGE